MVNQGDIIYKPPAGTEEARWGFILTADCDIAKDKSNARLSFLEIVSAQVYLERIWSSEVLRKARSKYLDEAASLISSAAQSVDEAFEPISPEQLLVWLHDTQRDHITSALQLGGKKKALHLDALEKVELAYGIRTGDKSPLSRLRQIWKLQKVGDKAIASRLEQALDYNQATDFHMIPQLPGAEHLGFVVLLREVISISHDSVYPSALALQIAGDYEGYHLAGPSTDNLRYAVSQKLAFLFSRIGMTDEYESQCGIATELTLGELATNHGFERISK
jgi:hypothetical protein